MTSFKKTTILALSAGILAASVSMAYADQYSEKIKTDPTAVLRSSIPAVATTDPQYTGSLKMGQPAPKATTKCSYEKFYWNTVFACDPEHTGNLSNEGNQD